MAAVNKPETRYAKAGGFNIAYQVVGDGPVDLIVVPGFISHLELLWSDPDWTRGIERMASFARLILFDKRGTGLSDPTPVLPTLEERVDDIRAVMDAAGSEQAALFGFSEGAAMSLLLAASEPDRVSSLILVGSLVTGTPAPGSVPWAERCAAAYDGLAEVVEHWGEGRLLEFMAPSLPQTELARRLTGTLERHSASPAMAAALVEGMRRIDLGGILAALDRPTLVMHRADEVWPVEAARDVANRVRGARYVELVGADHWWWVGDQETLVGEVEEFPSGHLRCAARRAPSRGLFCSPTSSGRRRWRLSSAIPHGAHYSVATTTSSVSKSRGSAAARSRPPVTASSSPSTVRLAVLNAPERSPEAPRTSG